MVFLHFIWVLTISKSILLASELLRLNLTTFFFSRILIWWLKCRLELIHKHLFTCTHRGMSACWSKGNQNPEFESSALMNCRREIPLQESLLWFKFRYYWKGFHSCPRLSAVTSRTTRSENSNVVKKMQLESANKEGKEKEEIDNEMAKERWKMRQDERKKRQGDVFLQQSEINSSKTIKWQ